MACFCYHPIFNFDEFTSIIFQVNHFHLYLSIFSFKSENLMCLSWIIPPQFLSFLVLLISLIWSFFRHLYPIIDQFWVLMFNIVNHLYVCWHLLYCYIFAKMIYWIRVTFNQIRFTSLNSFQFLCCLVFIWFCLIWRGLDCVYTIETFDQLHFD